MPNGLTAAAARRSLGEWRLDDPALDFDASVWWFKLDFGVNFVANLPAASDATTEHWLHFDGLATLCQVWLNDQLLVQSDNMFLAHAVPVSSALLVGTNCLVIRCDALTNALAVKRPRPQWRTPMVAHQQLRWLRTTLLGRTPGWSPPAAVVGPWRPVWLEARQAHQLVAVQLHASVGASGAGQITAALEFHQGCNPRYSYAVVVRRLQGPKEGPKEK
jgi:beta-mannosidase